MTERPAFCFYRGPDGVAYGDTDLIRAAGGVGTISHLGFGDFMWRATLHNAKYELVFNRQVDNASSCAELPPVWQEAWQGRVHVLTGAEAAIDALVEALTSLWGDRQVVVHSIEGGRGVLAREPGP